MCDDCFNKHPLEDLEYDDEDDWSDEYIEDDECCDYCGKSLGACDYMGLWHSTSPASGDTGPQVAASAGSQDSDPSVQKGTTMSVATLPTTRQHRTALVIDTRNGVTAGFRERYKRLLQSVNGANIKVDVFTLRGNATQTGPGLVSGTPDTYVAPETVEAEIDLKAWAKDLGYDQLVVAVDPKAA